MQIVFATNNLHKIKEVQALLPPTIALMSLSDIGCLEEIPETSSTIEGNAVQKATFIKAKYGYDCFADDTGLEVDTLYGAPGVYSARYAGPEKNPEANMNKLLVEMADTSNRNARFKTIIALCLGNEVFQFEGICKGIITHKKKGKKGFGYDPIFQPDDYSQTFAELPIATKNTISHRGKAVRNFVNFMGRYHNF